MSEPMKLTKKMQAAMVKTVEAYDRAIEDLKNGVDLGEISLKWLSQHCRLCAAMNALECNGCPLNDFGSSSDLNCLTERRGIHRRLLVRAGLPAYKVTRGQLLKEFRNRLKWIHKRIGANGWEVK